MERLLEVKAHLHNLSLLVMSPVRAEEAFDYVAGLCLEARTHFLKLADAHHVVIRALEPLEQAAVAAGAGEVAQFANAALGREHRRIATGLKFLSEISGELEAEAGAGAVMETMAAWPALGN